MVSLREWHLQARFGGSWRASRLLHRTFVVLRRMLTTVGGRLNFGVSGRRSITMRDLQSAHSRRRSNSEA